MKDEAIGHRKMKKLCLRLNCRLYTAIGILESLWKLTKREAVAGDIGKLSNEDIAIGIDYEGDPDVLVEALTWSGWLDKSDQKKIRLLVHDWAEHCEDLVHLRLARARELFADGSIPDPPLSALRSSERPQFLQWVTAMSPVGSPVGGATPPMDTRWSPTPTPTPEEKTDDDVKFSSSAVVVSPTNGKPKPTPAKAVRGFSTPGAKPIPEAVSDEANFVAQALHDFFDGARGYPDRGIVTQILTASRGATFDEIGSFLRQLHRQRTRPEGWGYFPKAAEHHFGQRKAAAQ